MFSAVVRNTAAQVRAGLHAKGEYAYRLIAVDALTLRVHRKRRGVTINTDITYDRGPDTYTVTRHHLTNHGLDCTTDEPISGIYFDQLADVILMPEREGRRPAGRCGECGAEAWGAPGQPATLTHHPGCPEAGLTPDA